MIFEHKYGGSSSVSGNAKAVGVSFAPDTLREPTYFIGKLQKSLHFREAISALHYVVVSDLRLKPKERTDYQAWLKEQEPIWMAEYMAGASDVRDQIEAKKLELEGVRKEKAGVMAPYYKAQQAYFNYLYKKDMDMWYVLDPVITVHPDEIFFECFSQDESSYGKLSCDYGVFKEVEEFKCGTTNIDYSQLLYDEFQKIRTYKETEFKVDPSGFEIQTTNEDSYKEMKIDLPDSWVRGFLQVSSAMTLPASEVTLEPMDLHNLLFYLKRFKEKEGPRSIRFILKPGKPVQMLLEPWGHVINCPRSLYKGDTEREIRIWGRRRLLILERLLPIAEKINITLLGTGLPSFYQVKMGGMTFTLGLSGWTQNDWSKMGQFDLMAPRRVTDAMTQQKVFLALKENWLESADSLAGRLGMDKTVVLGALGILVQSGKVIYDLEHKVYRVRILKKDELPMDELRFASEAEAKATKLIAAKSIKIVEMAERDGVKVIRSQWNGGETTIYIDSDDRLIQAECNCNFFRQNRLRKGPCEHIIATRMLAAAAQAAAAQAGAAAVNNTKA